MQSFFIWAIVIYLAAISIISVVTTIADKKIAVYNGELEKKKSKKKQPKRRVPERTLLILSALGGSIAMLATMKSIRHKTQHKKFMIGIPVIIILQAALVVGIFLLFR